MSGGGNLAYKVNCMQSASLTSGVQRAISACPVESMGLVSGGPGKKQLEALKL